MIYFHKELKKKLGSSYQVKKALENSKYYKIDCGLYSSEPSESYLAIIMKKYPYAVIYGVSAYYYYDYTDFIPDKIVLATKQHETIRSKHIKQVRVTDSLYELGKTTIQKDGISINIYDKERMLIELARNKNKMGYDLYKEIISNYRKHSSELDIERIENYLEYFVNAEKIFEIIQDEVY